MRFPVLLAAGLIAAAPALAQQETDLSNPPIADQRLYKPFPGCSSEICRLQLELACRIGH